MKLRRRWKVVLGTLGLVVAGAAWFILRPPAPNPELIREGDARALPEIPRTFDDTAIRSVHLPLAQAGTSAEEISSSYYYGIGVRPLYKSYPVYSPDKEPAGYLEELLQKEPEIAFDASTLKTEEDWIRAGELVFDAPSAYGHIAGPIDDLYTRDPAWYKAVAPPTLPDGTIPALRYIVRKKGDVQIGVLSCLMCHTRVLPDGTLLKGAQGTFPFDRALAWDYDILPGPLKAVIPSLLDGLLYNAHWMGSSNPMAVEDDMSGQDIAAMHGQIPGGVIARHGTGPGTPARVPDLIGVKDRRYLDATGLNRHRDIGDMMRYAAMNQDTDLMATYQGKSIVWLPVIRRPDDPARVAGGRYSDTQLFALAKYLYSLQPPPNPNPFNAEASAGQKIFEREGCPGCHTPPLYTNNKLTLAKGFTPPQDHLQKFDVLPVSVGTDPTLALKTRRGTGYYKVPSLKGVWYRGPLEHNGSVATLEDWFDPRRLQDDYVPTGFKGYNRKTRAVRGHEFGLRLTVDEKRSLIAFLRSL